MRLFFLAIGNCCVIEFGEASPPYPPYREKCEVTKNQICEVMGLVSMFRKNKMKKVPLPKMSLLVQIAQMTRYKSF